MSIILRVTNALLAVVALCLILIVVKLYDAEVVPSAQAQYGLPGVKPVVQDVHVVNPDFAVKASGPALPVYVVYRQHDNSFVELPVAGGVLVRQAH